MGLARHKRGTEGATSCQGNGMKRLLLPLLVLGAFGLPGPVLAQDDPAERITGVETPPPSALELEAPNPDRLLDYLRAVRVADMAIEIEEDGPVEEGGTDRLVIEGQWERRPGERAPRLRSMTMRPGAPRWLRNLRAIPPGRRRVRVTIPGIGRLNVREIIHQRDGDIELEVDGRNYVVKPNGAVDRAFGGGAPPPRIGGGINEVRIDAQGRIHIDRDGIDVTVERMTRDRNGNLILHIPGFWQGVANFFTLGGADADEIVVRPDGSIEGMEGDLGLLYRLRPDQEWPPSIDTVVNALREGGGQTGVTENEAIVRYRVRGRADPYEFPFAGNVRAESSFDVSGAVALRPDGTTETVGDGSQVRLDLRIGGQPATFTAGRGASTEIHADRAEGTLSLSGDYRVRIPSGDGDVSLVVDGDVRYDVRGSGITLELPSGARIDAASAELGGGLGIRSTISEGGTQLIVGDGRYALDLRGPIQLDGLEAGPVHMDDLDFTGDLRSEGRLSVDGDRVGVEGDLRGDLVARGDDGFVQVLTGELSDEEAPRGRSRVSGRVREGSRVRLDLDAMSVGSAGNNVGGETRFDGFSARGRIEAEAGIDDVEVRTPEADVDADRAHLSIGGELDFSTRDGLRSASGDAALTLESDGELTVDGLPGAPVLPGRDGRTRSPEPPAPEPVSDDAPAPEPVVIDDAPAPEPVVVDDAPEPEPVAADEAPARPAFITHVVAPGETLGAIARRYGEALGEGGVWSHVDDIRAANGIPAGSSLIHPGQPLRIPDRRPRTAPASAGPEASPRPRPNPRREVRDEPAAPAAPEETEPTRLESPRDAPDLDVPDGTWTETLAAGSEVRFDDVEATRGPDGAMRVSGRLSTTLELRSGELRTGRVAARIVGAARASLEDVPFEVNPGERNPLRLGRVEVPVRLRLDPGTHVYLQGNGDGPVTDVLIDREGSYANFTAVVVADEEGLRVPEVREVDLSLESTAAARFAGDSVDVPGRKTVSYQGRMVFVAGGIDFYGDVTIRVHGSEDTPILRIRW